MPSDSPGHTTKLSSSLRIRGAEASLALAKTIAMSRGVSRVIDTTWLDRIGIPVYSSVRPDAHRDSLCVHAGKGYTHAEAKIGAYMEAIEYSFSPEGRSRVPWQLVGPEDILASFRGQLRFTEFCPRVNRSIAAGERVAAVSGDEIFAGLGPVLVPAELVYHPFPGNPGQQLYGNSTNGLASGNTVDEATVHALAEVLERDVQSFASLGAAPHLVHNDSLPSKGLDMVQRIEHAGLECHVRYLPNDFGLPFFVASILEPERDEFDHLSVQTGYGLHCNSDIACVRAVAEAVQSRVTAIHGGRDDLVRQHQLADKLGRRAAYAHLLETRVAIADASRAIRFEAVPSANVDTIQQAQAALFAGLERAGLRFVVRVVYTEPDYPFQIVRIIVPGAEFYEYVMRRVGPRLLNYFKATRERLDKGGTT